MSPHNYDSMNSAIAEFERDATTRPMGELELSELRERIPRTKPARQWLPAVVSEEWHDGQLATLTVVRL